MKKNGILLLSGLLKEDQEDILQAADQVDLEFMNKLERNNWLGIRLSS